MPPGGLCNFFDAHSRMNAAKRSQAYTTSMIGGFLRVSCLLGIGGFNVRNSPHVIFAASV
jgi:hypothetical protein